MGFEDEAQSTDDAVEAANTYQEKQRAEADQKAELARKRQAQIEFIIAVIDEKNKPIVDNLKEHGDQIQYIASELGKQREALDQIIGLIKGTPVNPAVTDQTAQAAQALGILDHPVLGKIIDKFADKMFSENTGPAPLIDQQVINEKMTKAFMDDLSTGESIRQFITDSLKKKATKAIVNKSLGEIGRVEDEQHIPE